VLVTADNEGIDVALASEGKFGPDLGSVYEEWSGFSAWAEALPESTAVMSFARSQLGSPSPTPRQIVAIGLNYRAHAAESGFAVPDSLPPTFTKFVSALAGPDVTVTLPPGGHTDWEVELVVVIGQIAKNVDANDAWDYVAGVCVGQDISERVSQLRGPAPQFSLGKSFPNFAPVGPWLVTPDALPNRNDLALRSEIDGQVMQSGRTRDLIFPVSELVARLSETITLYPGDLIFTGTPEGVGLGRDPQRWLQPGETLVSSVEGIGEIRQLFVAEEAQTPA
jgi:2-keto-4-pentenoate hydratase/2-oxohepta-3-ene-1,7-dioic acid hydratase in catechol pathway